jgi:hypothetical protein
MLPQLVATLPWGHHRVLLDRIKDHATREWYLKAAVEYGDFGILKWPTSAVCFGPPWVERTSSLDLSEELGSGGEVGLESQGGTVRADPTGV